ncbi:MAG: hypothetical protein GXP31_00415 [Kiritimatiellaeota bacterium]|nr:hypothetical protein [Kiritimatiellota bacterium]
MKALFSRRNTGKIALACGVVLLALAVAGCQTPGKLVSTATSTVCPMCKSETRTTAVKGLTYTKHICPKCKTVRNTGTSDEAADATQVHVCDQCKAVVNTCPLCTSK